MRGVLTGRDDIVATARGLIEAGGAAALTMRKLAAELGVAPTAIYWHVGSRDDVLNAVLDAMVADLPPIAAVGATPKDRLASVATQLRAQVHDTQAAQQLAQELGRTAELSFPAQVALAREVEAAGLHGGEAAQAVRSVLYLVGGFILLEDNFSHRPAGRTTQELWAGVDDADIGTGLRQAMTEPVDTDRLFAYAVERLLESILRPAV